METVSMLEYILTFMKFVTIIQKQFMNSSQSDIFLKSISIYCPNDRKKKQKFNLI